MNANQIKDFTIRTKAIRQVQSELEEELLSIETWLTKFMDDMKSVNIRFKEIIAVSQQTTPSGEKRIVSDEDFKIQLEKLLQGSLDAFGDKISNRILNMLKELKETVGPDREFKIREIKKAAENEMIDLSSLFLHEKIKSNIEDIGVEEEESKGIDRGLEHLRRMKSNESKPPEPDKDEKDK